MKKVFLISLFVIFGLVQMSAQMAVTDPGQMAINQAGWASSLEKAASQIEILTKNKEILTESINLYAKVSGFLKTSQLLFNVIDRQVKIVKLAADETTRKDYANVKMYMRYTDRVKEILEESQGIFSLAQSIVTPSAKMTDGERLQMLSELNKQTKEFYSKLQLNKSRFETYNNAMKKLKKR